MRENLENTSMQNGDGIYSMKLNTKDTSGVILKDNTGGIVLEGHTIHALIKDTRKPYQKEIDKHTGVKMIEEDGKTVCEIRDPFSTIALLFGNSHITEEAYEMYLVYKRTKNKRIKRKYIKKMYSLVNKDTFKDMVVGLDMLRRGDFD